MRINSLTSSANSLLKTLRSLQERNARQKTGLFLLEGEKLLLEATARNVPIEAVVLDSEYFARGVSQPLEALLADHDLFPEGINLVSPKLFKELATTSTSCGLVAAARGRQFDLDQLLAGRSAAGADNTTNNKIGTRTILYLDAIQDPGNLGSIIRSALAFDACGLILGKGTVDPYNPKVVRSAMGALFDLPMVEGAELAPAIKRLKQAGFTICGLSPEASAGLEAAAGRDVCFLLGNEGAGLSSEASQLADLDLKIAMSSQIESLNVSIAAAIVLFDRYKVANGC